MSDLSKMESSSVLICQTDQLKYISVSIQQKQHDHQHDWNR